MRQPQNYFWDTICRIGGWQTNTKIIKTETLLHLNLEIFLYILFIYLFFPLFFLLFFIFLIFYFQSSLCLSNACSAYCSLVHYFSLFISLKLFSLFCFFLLVYLFFPFPLTFLLSIAFHPSILNITRAIITSIGLGWSLGEDLLSQWPPKTGRSSNTYLQQSRLQIYMDQTR
jgi:hypothetical protein